MRRRKPLPINQTINQTPKLSKKLPESPKLVLRIKHQTNSAAPTQSLTNSNDEVTHRKSMMKDILFYPDPSYRSPPSQ